MHNAVRTLHGSPNPQPSRDNVLAGYAELMQVYERKCAAMVNAVETVCQELVIESKVPEISAATWSSDGGVEDEEDMRRPASDVLADGAGHMEDPRCEASGAVQSRDVKRCFVEAMERLQSTSVPKKRRGNLPKDATATFRKWFDDHHDHPYPTDEEKRILAAETGTAISQITNWFINHRKRVWKPSLARDHHDSRIAPHLLDQNSM
jgi:hypothetical protein